MQTLQGVFVHIGLDKISDSFKTPFRVYVSTHTISHFFIKARTVFVWL